MKSFNEFNEYLLEKLITFGGKAYPKFGNVVILAGGGGYLKDANFFYIKRAGKAVMNFDDIDKDIRAKIRNYVPKGAEW